jgi:hypothetical protein
MAQEQHAIKVGRNGYKGHPPGLLMLPVAAWPSFLLREVVRTDSLLFSEFKTEKANMSLALWVLIIRLLGKW